MFDWQFVHGMLKDCAARRATLDVEEAKWLREADRLRIWRRLGMATALDYVERVLGCAPHAARERLRVARALAELPALEAALGRGALCFSAVKELSRIANAETERAWIDAVAGRSLRDIEDVVAGRLPGDRPDDPARPDRRTRKVTLELSADVYARLGEVRARLAAERGDRLDDDALVRVLCDAVDVGAGDGARARAGAPVSHVGLTGDEGVATASHVGQTGAGGVAAASHVGPTAAKSVPAASHVGQPSAEVVPAASHVGQPSAEVVPAASHVGQTGAEVVTAASHVAHAAGDPPSVAVTPGVTGGVAGQSVDAEASGAAAAASVEHLVRQALRMLVPRGGTRAAPG